MNVASSKCPPPPPPCVLEAIVKPWDLSKTVQGCRVVNDNAIDNGTETDNLAQH